MAPNSPAAAAGIQPCILSSDGKTQQLGDCVVGIYKKPVSSYEELCTVLGGCRAGDFLIVRLMDRHGQCRDACLQLGTHPKP